MTHVIGWRLAFSQTASMSSFKIDRSPDPVARPKPCRVVVWDPRACSFNSSEHGTLEETWAWEPGQKSTPLHIQRHILTWQAYLGEECDR